MSKRVSLLLVTLFVFCSCSPSFDSAEELMSYITDKDNGYVYSKTVRAVDYTLLCRPGDLVVAQMLNDSSDVEELRERAGRYFYFDLSISKSDQEILNSYSRDRASFGKILNDLSFNIDQKVSLVSGGGDTLALADFVYPRMYGMSRSTSVMIAFSRGDKALSSGEELSFTIRDLGIGTGDVVFRIPSDRLIDQPKLNFN